MNVSIIHHSLNSGGGSERVCLEMINALKRKGHYVVMCTFDKSNWAAMQKLYGEIEEPDEEIVMPRLFWNFTYGEMLNFSLLALKILNNSDIIILSSTSPNTFGIVRITKNLRRKKIVVYVNMPPIVFRNSLRYYYYSPYVFLQRKFINNSNTFKVLSNSSFTSKIIKETFGIDSEVVYPPVNIDKFYVSIKEDIIASLGRFSPFKRFEVLINSMVKADGKCVIMGSAASNSLKISLAYIRKLKKIIRSFKLQNKVSLIINPTFDKVREILSKSKIYVNSTIFEPFGISVVESMASGCVPIVHRSGGPYIDIIGRGKYGFSFQSSDELAKNIHLLIDKDELCILFSRKAIERAKIYSAMNFQQKMLDIVEEIY